MTALANTRHERFAQERAKGLSIDAAYTAAGFRPHRGNAARLSANESVRARVAELQERGAIRAEITVAAITDRLGRIADTALEGATPEEDGKPDAQLLNVARQAAMDIAKLNGLIVDQSKVQTIPADVLDRPMSEDEWASQSPVGHA